MSTITKADDKALLAPLEIWEVQLGSRTIKFFEPLILTPTWMPDDPEEPSDEKYLEIEYPELNLSSWGKNRRELWECIQGDIRFIWTTYVNEDDSKLSIGARAVKSTYLDIAEVIDG